MEKCPVCKGEIKLGFTTFTVDLEETIIVIRKVKAQVCDQCGESWIDDSTSLLIEKIVEEAKKKHSQVEILTLTA
ncbi:MAG: type II toxin-antitoxin system MqsA family antitoxin [Candidatus Cloacimonetes bacterium]|nr:type II toxin-antitoxin system MqsA family antitoxin [Candidatus Cloacimonadota bacterium]